ncbi:hypothetical protein KY289_008627 [Solanum tuberosum]|nr:hypothetical protein KY289_008627 [Solanum tuberosum]
MISIPLSVGSKELAQLDASFQQPTPQQVAHSQSNVDIARSGISHTTKEKKAKERIEKNYGITRQILEQHLGMTLKQAAKALHVSESTLKRIRKVYGMPRWPNHKTIKDYHHVSQGISLPGVADHLVLNRKNVNTRSTLVDCGLLDNNGQIPIAPPKATDPHLNDLHIAREQNDALRTEIETLRTNLAESQREVARLKDQLLQQQQDSNTRVDNFLKLLASSHSPLPSSS